MHNFKQILYEALLVAFGKTLAKYNGFAQATIMRDVGRELIDYLNRHGFAFEEKGDPGDLAALTNLFVENGFAEKLEVRGAERGQNFIWHELYGRNAYKELHDVSDNPFLACPLNLCLYYIAEKHHKSMRLLSKSFPADGGPVESQYEIVDQAPPTAGEFDPLVIENARLVEVANERAAALEAEVAQRRRAEEKLQEQKRELEREIEERKRAEHEVARVHRELLNASRRAGQAEVASSVLHNVGNVLNSVNVSASVLGERLRKLRVGRLGQVAQLMNEHTADLGAFLVSDRRGRQIPGYLGELAQQLGAEQAELLDELKALARNVEHIKVIIASQQTYARANGVVERTDLADVIDEALDMHLHAFERHAVQVTREFESVPVTFVDKHKVLQILVNLLHNAKQACDEGRQTDRRVAVRLRRDGGHGAAIEVADNGVGIPAENLTKIFGAGFTTRRNGHGFGVHSAALAAAEMGGKLAVRSEGPGCGATFTLHLPLRELETPAETLVNAG